MTRQWRVGLLVAAMAVAVPAWAGDSGQAAKSPDPWEGFNRKMFSFNDAVDRHALKPVAQFYRKVTPDFVMEGVSNFFSNLGEPLTVVNLLFQGKVKSAVNDTGRFLLNTTVGVLGLFDVASHARIEHHKEDFGQTLGVWGVKPGPYLVIPFLGPSSMRDLSGRGVDYFDNPASYHISLTTRVVLYGAEGVSDRAALIPMEGIIQGDKYLFVRDLYLQHREFEVQDGKVTDSFLDDDSSDEDSSGSTTPAAPAPAPAAPPAPSAPQGAAPVPAPGADAAPATVPPQASADPQPANPAVSGPVAPAETAISVASPATR
jgi:phospholipid-binding lipoprotein MlaA